MVNTLSRAWLNPRRCHEPALRGTRSAEPDSGGSARGLQGVSEAVFSAGAAMHITHGDWRPRARRGLPGPRVARLAPTKLSRRVDDLLDVTRIARGKTSCGGSGSSNLSRASRKDPAAPAASGVRASAAPLATGLACESGLRGWAAVREPRANSTSPRRAVRWRLGQARRDLWTGSRSTPLPRIGLPVYSDATGDPGNGQTGDIGNALETACGNVGRRGVAPGRVNPSSPRSRRVEAD